MFTGLIRHLGAVRSLTHGDTPTLTIDSRLSAANGDSVAVDGVCLSQTGSGSIFCAQLSLETIQKTTLGQRRSGDRVHLEPSLKVGDKLDGHLVMGHIDGVGTVQSRTSHPTTLELTITYPAELDGLIAVKGSIAINGVSLTVNRVEADKFSVFLVPITLEKTNLGQLELGDPVNLEADILARYVRQQRHLPHE